MKTAQINHHLEQANKIRQKLNAGSKPILKIKKPVNMRTGRFDSLILKLYRHEKLAASKISAGVKKWIVT